MLACSLCLTAALHEEVPSITVGEAVQGEVTYDDPHLGAGRDEELAAVQEVEEAVGHRLAGAIGDQDAVGAPRDGALVGLPGLEDVAQDRLAARAGRLRIRCPARS